MIGLPRSYGEIYGLLFASTRPLSFDESQERLELSQGSVSPSYQRGVTGHAAYGAAGRSSTADEVRSRIRQWTTK